MAWTQADADNLRAEIALQGGVQGLSFGDQSISFAQIEEKLKLLAAMEAALAAESTPPRNIRYAVTYKGA